LKKIGKVLELFISKKGVKNRIKNNKIVLDTNGITNDKFYNKNTNRSILLTNTSAYNIVLNKNIDISYGMLGENLLLDFDIKNINSNSYISIGSAILQITQNCTICEHLDVIHKDVPILLKDDRGVFVRVIKSGIINKNDIVYEIRKI